jgi:hypothetical protein
LDESDKLATQGADDLACARENQGVVSQAQGSLLFLDAA